MWKAVNAGDGASMNTLERCEMLEIFVRIAYAKYKEQGRATCYSDSLEIMLTKLKNEYEPRPWQQFRDEKLWKADINKLFKLNLPVLKKAYAMLFGKFGISGLKETIDLFCKGQNFSMPEKELRYCFGMSKMTIMNEEENGDDYLQLKFVEFLEFLARVADSKYDYEEQMSLVDKIIQVLDLVLPTLGLKRIIAQEDGDESVSSEESVIIDSKILDVDKYMTQIID